MLLSWTPHCLYPRPQPPLQDEGNNAPWGSQVPLSDRILAGCLDLSSSITNTWYPPSLANSTADAWRVRFHPLLHSLTQNSTTAIGLCVPGALLP